MKYPKYVTAFLLNLIAGQSLALSYPVDVTSQKLDAIHLDGCGRHDAVVMNYGPGQDIDGEEVINESLQLSFDNLGVLQDGRGNSEVNCIVSARIKVPAGMKFRASSALLTGTHSLAEQASGGVSFSYVTEELDHFANNLIPFMVGQGQFELEAINQERDFTQCRDRDSTVTLSSHIEASITSYVNDLSEIILDNLDGESAVRWDWVWQKCEDDPSGAFDGYFTASRSTSSGNLEPASITIQGSRGEFFTRNGSGILRAIQYSAGGLVAEGLWEIGLDNGAFQFELDPSRGVFKGTYVNFSSGFRGEWKGYR